MAYHNIYKLYKPFRTTRTVLTLGIIAFITLINTPNVANANEQLFTVNNVKVDAKGENALKAREKAFEQAQTKAFDELSARMLSERAIKTYQTPPVSTISLMVQDYEVSNEKLAAARYSGTYKIRFNDKSVRNHFARSEMQSNPYANANTDVAVDSGANTGRIVHDDAYRIPTTTSAPAPSNAQALSRSQGANAIYIRTRFASLKEWSQTQRSLANVRSISDMSLNSLSSKEAILVLRYNSSLPVLQNELKQYGLFLGQPTVNAANQNIYDLANQKYVQQKPALARQMPANTATQNTPVKILNNPPAATRAPRASGNWANKDEPYQQKF